MSLDIWLYTKIDLGGSALEEIELHSQNITHNLGAMADAAGIYECLWCPAENRITQASQITGKLEFAVVDMEYNPNYYKKFDFKNGWGTYKDFLPWLRELLTACNRYPDAMIGVDR